MRKAPRMVDGMRGTGSREDLQPDGPQQTPFVLPPQPKRASGPEPVVFTSRYGGLRVQITAPADVRDPMTGRITVARPKSAQFVNGEYKTTDEDTINHLKTHRMFGIDFFLAAEIDRAAREKRYADTLAALKRDPEQVQRLLQDLKGEEFPLPQENAPAAQ